MTRLARILLSAAAVAGAVACGNGGLYAACAADAECTAPSGSDPACVQADATSFCTWTCADDDMCESSDATLLCASFEENPDLYCFPSCNEADDSCPDGFTCRSTGGGTNQRRVCYPGT